MYVHSTRNIESNETNLHDLFSDGDKRGKGDRDVHNQPCPFTNIPALFHRWVLKR